MKQGDEQNEGNAQSSHALKRRHNGMSEVMGSHRDLMDDHKATEQASWTEDCVDPGPGIPRGKIRGMHSIPRKHVV